MSALALTCSVTAAPSEAEREAVGGGLGGYNTAVHGPLPRRPLWLLLKDAAGELRAGAKCDLAWDWLYLDWLWVEEALRRQGCGTRLLAEAEAIARAEGCRGMHLHTWSFQAPDFYPRHGFTCAGQVADMPPGAARFWFTKRF